MGDSPVATHFNARNVSSVGTRLVDCIPCCPRGKARGERRRHDANLELELDFDGGLVEEFAMVRM